MLECETLRNTTIQQGTQENREIYIHRREDKQFDAGKAR